MKSIGVELQPVLYGADVHLMAELFTFEFREGTQRWTSADTDVVSGSATWSCSGPIITKGKSRTQSGLQVDTLDVTLVPGTGALGGTPMLQAALQGSFDDVRILVQRAFFSGSWGSLAGMVTDFDGRVVNVEPASTRIELTVKSLMASMSRAFPPRANQAQCPYILGDGRCGVSMYPHTFGLAASSGSTTTVVRVGSSTFPVDDLKIGTLSVVSGPMSGSVRTIVRNSQVATGITAVEVTPALPQVPVSGTSLVLSRGCDHTRVKCHYTFSNIARFGGFPDAPSTDAGR
ncbi:putative phage associated protein [Anaeromyxobacter dehalogenans 2CP-1]|uniref:Phage associated protein n=1 Tax=Anaeromyxobacter dehalogenans (strain ATCC BAA-258 / DSM 21875 / 2CP-1) TaxID=455488 RepID=B8JGI7_ANAD2|nr:DUF2163 domain-containing protein [Anaeromyxobacter dehalogenans]ACL64658.1 putative phage associated protein [Anaeromyxobacter dehalogenans 2CP-1]